MKLKLNGAEYEIKVPSRRDQRKVAAMFAGAINTRLNTFDGKSVIELCDLLEQLCIEGDTHPLLSLPPAAQIGAFRNLAQQISEGLPGEESAA